MPHKLLETKRVGLVLRVFSPTSELVEKNVTAIIKTLALAHHLVLDGKYVFSRIDVLISADGHYGDTDCGETRAALQRILDEEKNTIYRDQLEGDSIPIGPVRDVIHISEVSHGDIFCGLLNYGVARQLRDRIDYTMILSHGAKDYLTPENMELMLDALEGGAKVTGLAITELAPSILAGRLTNTCAIWDNVSLMTVGGFDLRAAKPLRDDRLARYVRGWSLEKNEVFYAAAGVEEIIPIIRLIESFGPCLAPVLPVTGARWVAPTDPEGVIRERKKMGTKSERQMLWCVAEGVDLSFIEGGVMPEYRQA